MKCLCCGKDLTDNATAQERKDQWHASCLRRFFGTSSLPELDVSEEVLTRIAVESTSKGFTVPGVQKKMSLHLTKGADHPRLTLVDYPTGFILKPQTKEYEALPEAEYLVMQMARISGIATVPFALIKTQGKAADKAYITRRIDRALSSGKQPNLQLLAMEDFCQLAQRLTEDKYRGSYERCAKIIAQFSDRPGLDLSELFMRVVFSFIVGNSDMHLKNFSLIETAACSQRYVLSAAYDMLPVNVILPDDDEQMALTLNGKKRNLRRNDFLKFAQSSDISSEAAAKMIRKLVSLYPRYLAMCQESYLPSKLKERFCTVMEERIAALL